MTKLFSDYLVRTSSDAQGKFDILEELLRGRFKGIDQDDKSTLYSVMLDDLVAAVRPFDALERHVKFSEELLRLESLAGEAAQLSGRLGHQVHFFDDDLDTLWNKFVFGYELERSEVDRPVLIPKYPSNTVPSSVTPAFALSQLEESIRLILQSRTKRRPKHRPKKEILSNACYPVIRCWCGLALIDGASVHDCFPSGRNGGINWCADVVAKIADGELFHKNEMGGRARTTIEARLQRVTKRLRELVAELPYVEPSSKWKSLNWDSFVGLELLCRAGRPPGTDCIIARSSCKHDFQSAQDECIRQGWDHKGEVPNWLLD